MIQDIHEILRQQVKMHKIEHGSSQIFWANRLDISASHFNKWINGKHNYLAEDKLDRLREILRRQNSYER